jgi:hypothetical protein
MVPPVSFWALPIRKNQWGTAGWTGTPPIGRRDTVDASPC